MQYAQFKKQVWSHYTQHGRHNLPWRKQAITPYQILVSEIMLQQTQVDRVIPKYRVFLKQFPNFKSLARAQQRDVLELWQGLGYNRRALNLKKTAETVTSQYNGQLPRDREALMSLPGIGPYISGAICVFAFNKPAVFIETNIRTVFLHHFFKNKKNIDDAEIIPLIEKTLDHTQSADWYAALMDYGSHLKKILPNPSRSSKHHTKQSKFEGSHRQKRGKIIKLLTEYPTLTTTQITQDLGEPSHSILKQLQNEGFIQQNNKKWSLI